MKFNQSGIMKGVYIFIVFSVITIINSSVYGQKTVDTREYSISHETIQSLKIVSSHGDITVKESTTDQLTINVEIVIEGVPTSKAEMIGENIDIKFEKRGGEIFSTPKYDIDLKSIPSFQVNYYVSIPSDKMLFISNKYGKVSIDNLYSGGEIEVEYGEFSANNFHYAECNSGALYLTYSSAQIISATNINLNSNYSTLKIGDAESISGESSYSVITADNLTLLSLTSLYDNITVGSIGTVKGKLNSSSLEIGEVTDRVDIENQKGKISIDSVSRSLNSISLSSNYSNIDLNMANIDSYMLNSSLTSCKTDLPKEVKEEYSADDNRNFSGVVGDGTGSGIPVTIVSKFSNITIK